MDKCSETWWTHFNLSVLVAKVNLAKFIGHEEHIPKSIGAGGPYGHRQPFKGVADFHFPPLPREPSLVLDPAYLVLGSILHRWQLFRKWPVAGLITAGWRRHSQGLMRPWEL